MNNEFDSLLAALREGRPVVLLDDLKREGEADLVLHAQFATPANVRLMRKEAGGLICLATAEETAESLGLGFCVDELRQSKNAVLSSLAIDKTPYGDSPAFSVWINHRKTYTGITDNDRSKTIIEFEKMVKTDGKTMQADFTKSFYAPGHVPLLISRSLKERAGHTELAVELARQAGLSPAVVVCEMLGEDGKARPWADVQALAKKRGWPASEGADIARRVGPI